MQLRGNTYTMQMMSRRSALWLCLMLVCLGGAALAQTALTGGLRGTVTDKAGATIPSATVLLVNRSLSYRQETVTDVEGHFTVMNLAPAVDYEVTVLAKGFRPLIRSGVTVVSSEINNLDARIEIAPVADTLNVNSTGEAQLSESPEVSQNVNAKQLRELPIYNRGQNRTALLDPRVRNLSGFGGDAAFASRISISGRSFRETHQKLDGNANFDALYNTAPLQTVSLSAVQEFKILTNQYSAEHGGTSAGFLILTTKSGADKFHGEGFFLGRPSGIQARPALASRRIPNQLFQFGASLGGPLWTGKTFFFVNYEGTRQQRGSFVERPRPLTFVGDYDEDLALIKIDHRFTANHTASLRLNGSMVENTNAFDRITSINQSVQPIQPSAATLTKKQEGGLQLSDTYVISSNFINELRASYVNAMPTDDKPLTPQVVVIRNGVSSEGNASFERLRQQNAQIADQMSLALGRHSLKFGGDYTRQIFDDVRFDQFGMYTFSADGALINFRQQLGIGAITYGQTRAALFVQDDWRLNRQLTLNFGVRYDYQSIIDDFNNFGPRFGFAYDVGGRGATVIRGGAGLYYDQPFLHGFTQLHLLNGPTALTRTVTLTPAQLAEAGLTFPDSFDSRDPRAVPPERRDLILPSEDYRNPYTAQFSLGVQQKLFGDFVVTADVTHNYSRNQQVNFNRNAPAPFSRTAVGQMRSAAAADATRPFTTFLGVPVRDVIVHTNGGNATYDSLALGVSRRVGTRYNFTASYVLSRAIDSIVSNPNDFSDVIGAERALSDFNQRHRFVAHGTLDLPRGFQIAGIATLASGAPVNPLTGDDNNGDGRSVDRPVGFGRNSFQGVRQSRLDASLAKRFRITENTLVEVRADIFNVFNNSNFYAYNNTYGNGPIPLATFLQPVVGISSISDIDPGRQLQFAVRLKF